MNRRGLFLIRVVALIAVMMMPFGMAGASASARHHQAMAVMAMDHCPDQNQEHGMASGLTDCTMACAAALPAVDVQDSLVSPPKADLQRPALAARLYGFHPETAKPPPRLS